MINEFAHAYHSIGTCLAFKGAAIIIGVTTL